MTTTHSADTSADIPRPRIMGILNVTPDSFSDGGLYRSVEQAVEQAEAMVEQGAELIDVGGESTRPGAEAVSLEEETERVIPVIEALTKRNLNAVISIDTQKPEIMKRSVEAGASMINDVYALRQPGAIEVAASLKVPVCLMHMQGLPQTMQAHPHYDDVIAEVMTFLQQRIDACVQGGISKQDLLIDPGFGFGKSLQHNLSLMKHLEEFKRLGLPILIGVSRKRMIGDILNKAVTERTIGSVVCATMAMLAGAAILRVHDVEQTRQAVKLYSAIQQAD